ncbi:peroxidase family protein [Polaromonas sp.]|uniref:peroxidase family protein n=1 Tax=Polaromonas sp. TaxID=1869339 RepID=UPI00286AFEBB|nr:peroxidase family protein [Polaromonas sp.]
MAGANLADGIQEGEWNGERLFQTAKFGTEMQYQHLVFEEFARTVQPNVDLFFAPTQVYDADLDPSIVAEFAHTVYRFGHSMLTETVDRFDPGFNVVGDGNPTEVGDQQTGLIAAFLNPLAYVASGPTPEQATGAIIRGLTRQVGNEIDEFVTEALRNNLVGLPLDLAALNLARGRDAGIPSLNAVRRDIYGQTGDSNLKPYTSWADLVQHLKHPESLINFIAAYGTHASITSATTLAAQRAAATLLVLGGAGAPADRLDFLNSTGTYASLASGVTTTGVDAIDLWIGGLAEEKMPFGGMLGTTFNFVFENQLEKLQDGDRFYYLERTAGLAFNAELESNSFAKLIMANTNVTHLPGVVFTTPTFTLELDLTRQFNANVANLPGADGILFDNPLTLIDESADNVATPRQDPLGGTPLTPLVIRNNPNTVGADTDYLQYTGEDHVVLGGTAGNDILISSIGDDTVWGDEGNDRIDGGYGNDQLRGGAGDDIITDLGGDDNIQGGDGNDVIQGGNGINLIIGGFGSDFIITGEDASEAIGGQGNDFILGSKANEQDMGNEGDDWIEKGTSDGAPGDNFDPLGNDRIVGNDVFIGDGENDKFNAEGGDDIMIGKTGFGDRYIGGSGYDWADFKDNPSGVYIDISNIFFDQPVMPSSATPLARFDIVEGLSGSAAADVLNGDDSDAVSLRLAGAMGSVLTNVALINNMQGFLNSMLGGTALAPVTFFDGGNIILGGAGSDMIQGRGGDDLIDGDNWLNVRISVRAGHDANGPTGGEIASFDSMTNLTLQRNMLNGTWNPGQLQIVREILTAAGPDFDTAVFAGNRADYTITTVGGVTTVTDNAGNDGTDHLAHIERLQFADQALVLGGVNTAPVGALTVTDSTPASPLRVGDTLSVSANGVTDANNIVLVTNPTGAISGPVAYFWQVDLGTGVFEDIVSVSAGAAERAHGPSFTPGAAELGFSLRVRAVYKDANGVLEQVFSAPTAAVAPANRPPVITSLAGAPTAAVSIAENTAAVTTVTATDADLDPLTYSIVGGADAARFTLNATTHALSFVTAPDFEAPTDAGPNNVYDVIVQVSDGSAVDTQAIAVTVTNVPGVTRIGTAGPDTLTGTNEEDTLIGLAGNDILIGLGGNDVLDGGDGNDTLNGGTGADNMTGGAGNDTYVVDNLGDATIETGAVGSGTDTVQSAINWTLGANVENLTLTGAAVSGTGNGLNNVLTGNALANTLSGGAGNDTLNGGAGADSMTGGAGDDSYVVDNLGDVTIEAGGVGSGTDTVQSAITWTLGANVENLTLTGAAIINGTGNAGNNVLTGNAAANTLSGGAGLDTLSGGAGNDILNGGTGTDTLNGGLGNDTLNGDAGVDILNGDAGNDTLNGGAGLDILMGGIGNDTYVVDNTLDLLIEGAAAGTDLVQSSASWTLGANLENLTLTGATAINGTGNGLANTLIGNSGANTLNGAAGNDSLNGGLGNDILVGGAGTDSLTGGAGADRFTFNATGDSVVGLGRDTIIDFATGDLINLGGIDANLNVVGNDAFSFIGTLGFSAAGQLRYSVVAGQTVIEGNVGGDLLPDFQIALVGTPTLVAGSFML